MKAYITKDGISYQWIKLDKTDEDQILTLGEGIATFPSISSPYAGSALPTKCSVQLVNVKLLGANITPRIYAESPFADVSHFYFMF